MTVYTYGLVDPRTGEIRYVGKAKDPRNRAKDHLCPCNLRAETHKVRWLRSLLSLGLKPNIVVFEETDEWCWQEKEKEWISKIRSQGCRLTNGTDGGEGHNGYVMPEEVRRKIAAANKGQIPWTAGKRHTPEAKAMMSAAAKGRKLSEGQVQCIRERQLGRKASAETRAKMSTAQKGHKPCEMTPEIRGKIATSLRGRQLPSEHRLAISLGGLGHAVSPETRAKIARSNGTLTEQDVTSIRERFAAGEKGNALAREFDVGPSAISAIVTRKTWRHLQ